jgi:hypothetical protein
MKTRYKNFIIALVLLASIATISIGYVFFASPDPANEFMSKIGETIKDSKLNSDIDSNKILAEADGIPITVGEFELKSKLYILSGYIQSEKEYDKVLKRIAKVKTLYKMAEEQGLNISFEEAQNASLEERLVAEKDPDTQAFMENYIKSLGISSDEYWEVYHANELVLYMSTNNLRSKILEEALSNKKLMKTEKDILIGTPKAYQDYLEDYIKEIEKNIKINIIDKDYEEKIK